MNLRSLRRGAIVVAAALAVGVTGSTVASAHPAPQPSGGHVTVQAPVKAKQIDTPAKNLAAQSEFNTELGTAVTVGGFLGTVIGGITGCVIGLPVAGVGCLAGIVPFAGVGGVVGTLLFGGPILLWSGGNLIRVLLTPAQAVGPFPTAINGH